jgi:hypothetical protein
LEVVVIVQLTDSIASEIDETFPTASGCAAEFFARWEYRDAFPLALSVATKPDKRVCSLHAQFEGGDVFHNHDTASRTQLIHGTVRKCDRLRS